MRNIAVAIEDPHVTVAGVFDPAWRHRPVWLSGYCFVGLAAIFYLPYLFPTKPSSSLSYGFGYNNHVAILLTLLIAGVGALWMKRISTFAVVEENDRPMPIRTFVLGLTGTLLVCAAAFPLVNTMTPVADAGYLVNRMQMLAAGQRPYLDFEFAYGPLFLYPPVWIAHLLHIGIAPAYYFFWVLNEIAGVLLLFRVLDEINIPSREKSAIFFCSAPPRERLSSSAL